MKATGGQLPVAFLIRVMSAVSHGQAPEPPWML